MKKKSPKLPRDRLPKIENDGLKMCTECGMELPCTSDYFDRDKTHADNLKNVCKLCRSAKHEERALAARDERLKKIDEASLKMLDRMVKIGSDVPHMAELYQRLMEIYDGVGGFAAHYMAQYLSAAPGSAVRQKMLDRIIALGIKVSEAGHAQLPVELMEDEDLQLQLQKQAQKFLVHYVDRTAEKAS